MIHKIRRALRLARYYAGEASYHFWRLVTGRASLHLTDSDGQTRFLLTFRKGR